MSMATATKTREVDFSPGSFGFDGKAVDAETYPLVFEMVPFKHLFIDTYAEAPEFLAKGVTGGSKIRGYQRMKMTNAENIAGFKYGKDGTPSKKAGRKGYDGGFRWDLFTPLIVSKRSATRYAVLDGGSRFLALGLMQAPGDALVPVMRYRRALDYKEEAILFVTLNEQRLGLTAVDTFMAKVEYGDRDSVNVDRLLKTVTGITIGNSKGEFSCVQAIMDLWSHQRMSAYEGESLRKTMDILVQAGWIHSPKGRVGTIVAGVGRLAEAKTISGKELDFDRLVSKLESFTHADGRGKTAADRALNAANVRETNSRSRSKHVALVLAETYNKGLRGNARIDTVQFLIADSEDEE